MPPLFLTRVGRNRYLDPNPATRLKPLAKGSRVLVPTTDTNDDSVRVAGARPGQGHLSLRQYLALYGGGGSNQGGVTATSDGDALVITWLAYSGAGTLTGYEMWRKFAPNAIGANHPRVYFPMPGQFTSSTLSATDATVYDGETASYQVRARLSDGNTVVVATDLSAVQPARTWVEAEAYGISAGGTYTGLNIRNITNLDLHVVDIKTSAFVKFVNCRFAGVRDGVSSRSKVVNGTGYGTTAGNLEFQNCRFWQLPPTVVAGYNYVPINTTDTHPTAVITMVTTTNATATTARLSSNVSATLPSGMQVTFGATTLTLAASFNVSSTAADASINAAPATVAANATASRKYVISEVKSQAKQGGAAIDCGSGWKHLVVEHCYFDGWTMGVKAWTYTGDHTASNTYRVRYNWCRRPMGQRWDSRTSSGYDEATPLDAEAAGVNFGVFMQTVVSAAGNTSAVLILGAEISWNLIQSEPGYGRVEDNISNYQSHWDGASPPIMKYNFVDGAYPFRPWIISPVGAQFSGGGLMIGDQGSDYIQSEYNHVIRSANYGVALLMGHGSWQRYNRIVSSRYLVSDGSVRQDRPGFDTPLSFYPYGGSTPATFYGNDVSGNLYWQDSNAAGPGNSAPTDRTTWSARAPYTPATGNGASPPNTITAQGANTQLTGTLDTALEWAEYPIWWGRMASAGVTVGP